MKLGDAVVGCCCVFGCPYDFVPKSIFSKSHCLHRNKDFELNENWVVGKSIHRLLPTAVYHEKAEHVKGKGTHNRQQNIIHDTEKSSGK